MKLPIGFKGKKAMGLEETLANRAGKYSCKKIVQQYAPSRNRRRKTGGLLHIESVYNPLHVYDYRNSIEVRVISKSYADKQSIHLNFCL